MNDKIYHDPDDHSAHNEFLSERIAHRIEWCNRLHDEQKDCEMEDHFVKSNNKVVDTTQK